MLIKIKKDTLWKGVLEDLFAEFLLYFFPDWAKNEVDFGRTFEFLDKELEAIVPESHTNRRYADKLVKVFNKQGEEQWCLVHIEVQGYEENEFAERMYEYFSRIRERFKKKVLAIAIFTDDSLHFHPTQYHYEFVNTKLTYQFNTFKLLAHTKESLDKSDNPFSIIMLVAYYAIQKGMNKDSKQIEWKFELVRKFKEANYKTDKIRTIFNFIKHYVSFNSEKSQEIYLEKVSTIIKPIKNMGLEEAILAEIKEQAEIEGKIEGKKDDVFGMFEEKLPLEMICRITKLPITTIEEWKQEWEAKN